MLVQAFANLDSVPLVDTQFAGVPQFDMQFADVPQFDGFVVDAAPALEPAIELFGNPCYKGDVVRSNRLIEYPGHTVQKGAAGVIADNLGSGGGAPLNVFWKDDTRPNRPSYQITYADLDDASCMLPPANAALKGDAECQHQPAGTVLANGKVCEGSPTLITNRPKAEGLCVNQPAGHHVGNKVCAGAPVKKCPATKNCKGKGFGLSKDSSKRWPRFSAYDEFDYPVAR